MRTTRWGGVALVACCAMGAGARGELRPVEAERFAWGEPACGGLQAGLAVGPGPHRADQPLRYRFALVNRSARTLVVTLAVPTDERPRTRLVARQELVEDARPAVSAASGLPTTGMTVSLRPGETLARDGLPARWGSLRGRALLQLVLGGVRAQPCEVRSQEVWAIFAH